MVVLICCLPCRFPLFNAAQQSQNRHKLWVELWNIAYFKLVQFTGSRLTNSDFWALCHHQYVDTLVEVGILDKISRYEADIRTYIPKLPPPSHKISKNWNSWNGCQCHANYIWLFTFIKFWNSSSESAGCDTGTVPLLHSAAPCKLDNYVLIHIEVKIIREAKIYSFLENHEIRNHQLYVTRSGDFSFYNYCVFLEERGGGGARERGVF